MNRINRNKEGSLTLKSGRTLAYAEFGDPAGAGAFHFHGWPFSRLHAWSMHAAAERQGIRLICPDRPGLGASEAQPDRELGDWPPVVEELADHFGWERFHVMGVSGGGPYALACARSLAHRLLSCHVVGGAPPIHEVGATGMHWIYRVLIKLRQFSPVALSWALLAGAELATRPPDFFLVRNLISLFPDWDRRVLRDADHFQSLTQSLRQAMQNGTDSVITDADLFLKPWPFEIHQIKVPVHFWHGQQDRNISWTYSAQLAAQLPQAKTHWFPEEGHYSLPINQADQVFSEMREQEQTS
jgi:pimeloyl-ACP methyl ester carboxylesterase